MDGLSLYAIQDRIAILSGHLAIKELSEEVSMINTYLKTAQYHLDRFNQPHSIEHTSNMLRFQIINILEIVKNWPELEFPPNLLSEKILNNE